MPQDMPKKLLIDASHHEEMRVALVNGEKLEDFTVETADKVQNKGNIYVATVSRVEPSLQAAFITYGGERNGFLAFGELHPEYFDVSAKEKKELLKEIAAVAERRKNRNKQQDEDKKADENAVDLSDEEMDEDARALAIASGMENPDNDSLSATKRKGGLFKRLSSSVSSTLGGSSDASDDDAFEIPKVPIHRRYKIEDVLKEGQKILVQVVKEERGTKGAALTTYFALPGRFTVLMPNSPLAGGISRKVSDYEDRQQLKEVYNQLSIPNEMGLIIRTAGVGQDTKAIQKDFKNLTKLWKDIQKALKGAEDIACVHEDGSIVIRTLRDMLQDDIDELVISGKTTYKQAKGYMKSLMPDIAKITKEHKEDTPLFIHYGVEQKLARLHHTRVNLPSGGYLIINPTEALVAVDVNSGRNTSQKNVEETAFKTNMEAAEEVARQMRLRDLAGLIVVDFIDMEDYKHNRSVERAMRKAIRRDRARTQTANISQFGLMEISRQRLRPSFEESHFMPCPHCSGTGLVHTVSAAALMLLRRLEEADARDADKVVLHTSTEAVVYILNHKRSLIQDMEAKYKYQIQLRPDENYPAPDHKLDVINVKADGSEKCTSSEVTYREEPEAPAPQKRRRRKSNNSSDKSSEKSQNTRTPRKAKEDAKAEDKPARKSSPRRAKKEETPSETSAIKADKASKPEASSEEKKPARRGRKPARVSETTSEKAEAAPSEKPEEKKAAPKKATAKKDDAEEAKPAPKKRTPKPKDKPVAAVTVEADTAPVKPAKKKPARQMKVVREEHADAPSAPVAVEKVVQEAK